MRALVDIPDQDFTLLQNVVKRLDISRAEFIRRAIDVSLAPYRESMTHEAFGLWASHPEDGLAYQEKVREEW